jgi:hypothetical protein
MSDTLIVALIAATVTLVVAFINTVVSESYKRFRDGTIVAASLAGELAAYEEAWPLISEFLDSIVSTMDGERPNLDALRPIDRPKDLVYEKSIEKLGLLGAPIAEDVVYVYSNINAFRIAFEIISRDHKEMSTTEIKNRCVACKAALDRAVKRGEVLLSKLRSRSTERFSIGLPFAHWLALLPKRSSKKF